MKNEELLSILLKYVRPRKNANTRKHCRLVCDEMDVEDYEKVLDHFGVELPPRTKTAFVLKEKATGLYIQTLIKVNNCVNYKVGKDNKLLFTNSDLRMIKNLDDFIIETYESGSHRAIRKKLGGTKQKELKKWSYVYDRQK